MQQLLEKTQDIKPAAGRHEKPDLNAQPTTGVGLSIMKIRRKMVEDGKISNEKFDREG
jgi:hypothetical protein